MARADGAVAVQSDAASREVVGGAAVGVNEEAEFELLRMRSLVEHLQERLDRVEGDRNGSFGSASSGRMGWVDHQALDRELARQARAREFEAYGLRGSEIDSISRFPSVAPRPWTPGPPIGIPMDFPKPPSLPPALTSWPTQGSHGPPQHYLLSPRARAPDALGVIKVQRVDHVWRVTYRELQLSNAHGN